MDRRPPRPARWFSTRFRLVFLIRLFLSGSAAPVPAERRPVLVVSTTMLESLVRDAGGARFEILTLMPPTSCPGHSDLKPGDRMAMGKADLILFHGLVDEPGCCCREARRERRADWTPVAPAVCAERGPLPASPVATEDFDRISAATPPH